MLDPPRAICKRFTPTRVGTTPRRAARVLSRTVHPHACGDDQILDRRENSGVGSPPRVWGRPLADLRSALPSRFTPTRVGTTKGKGAKYAGDNGSPPRVWGRHRYGEAAPRAKRFTPTRVGTTALPFAA